MLHNPYNQYRTTAVSTARPIDLVVMLYKGAVRFTQRGMLAVEQKDVDLAHQSFTRAQDIISELVSGLNPEQGGAIAAQLSAIYDYIFRLLIEANCEKSVTPASEALALLTELLTAWQALADGRAEESLGLERVAVGAH
jgi:flagellar protein FliS